MYYSEGRDHDDVGLLAIGHFTLYFSWAIQRLSINQ